MSTTEVLIKELVDQMRAPRNRRFIFAGGRGLRIWSRGETRLLLPNGSDVKITTDDSGVATQVEENDSLHAVVRPEPIHITMPRSRGVRNGRRRRG